MANKEDRSEPTCCTRLFLAQISLQTAHSSATKTDVVIGWCSGKEEERDGGAAKDALVKSQL